MTEIILKARAKVNLTLDVIEKLEDGYHRVDTVLHQVDLSDRITINTGSGKDPSGLKPQPAGAGRNGQHSLQGRTACKG